jgi:hypothetical protein
VGISGRIFHDVWGKSEALKGLPVSNCVEFGILPAQFKRDLDYMRSRLGAPVGYAMDVGGYKYISEELNVVIGS